MTKKGERIQSEILHYLERNPDGLRIGRLTDLLQASRNSVYRYLDDLEQQGLIKKLSSKLWVLTQPIKPTTILGYQYQALLQGLCDIGGNRWDISNPEGQENFKKLGVYIFPKMKNANKINIPQLKQQNHRLQTIIEYCLNLVEELSSVEQHSYMSKLTPEGFPDPDTNLAGVINLQGGYVQSDRIEGNGFAHYYIIAGIIEASLERVIPLIYGGRILVKVQTIDESMQLITLSLYVFFNKETPFIDPNSGQKIPFPQKYFK